MSEASRLPVPAVLCAACLVVLPSCTPSVIEGTVHDIKGEALPGVVVTVDNSSTQDLTDVLGAYRVPFRPGRLVLHISKSGYTAGRLELNVRSQRRVEAAPVKLWCLPSSKGVYLFEDFRYRAAKPIECEIFATSELGLVYGTRKFSPDRPDSVATTNAEPMILCYNVPRRGAGLRRLEQMEVTAEGARQGGAAVKTWLPTASLPVRLVAIDEPEGLLQQARIDGPLSPGTFALHWGALDGVTDLDTRMFVFTVLPGELAEGPDEPREPSGETSEDEAEAPSRSPKEEPPEPAPEPEPQPEAEDPVAPSEEKPTDLDIVEPVLHDL